MKNILDEIVQTKRQEVALRKQQVPVDDFISSDGYQRSCYSLKRLLLSNNSSGIIAEFKRRSPSGKFNNTIADPELVTRGYLQAGAVAVSVLTDTPFFGGSLNDLRVVRKAVSCPVLRKDFIIDEYQVHESKYAGADVILLIASVLTPDQVSSLTACAHQAGMEVILEVHNEEELDANRTAPADIFGVNNRDLKTLRVSVETSIRLGGIMPNHVVRIAESGIENPYEVIGLKRLGYRGFLIGQHFMQQQNPATACMEFIQSIEQTGSTIYNHGAVKN